MRKLLITGDFDVPKILFPMHYEIIHINKPVNHDQIKKNLAGVTDYILGGPEYLPSEMIDCAKELKNLVVMGTGTSSFVDLSYALAKNIRVENIPNLNTKAVIEFTVPMIMNCLSDIFKNIEFVRLGTEWIQTPRTSLKDTKIGIVGLGDIGSLLAEQLHHKECTNIFYWSRNRKLELESKFGLKYQDLQNMVQEMDIICIHVRSTNDTKHLFNSEILSRASSKLKIINMSNPNIICPVALKQFLLRDGSNFCVIDGYYQEWEFNKGISNDPFGLLGLGPSKFIATSHIAAQEFQTVKAIFLQAANKIIKMESDL